MLKHYACAIACGLLMISCTTVEINTLPDHATIHLQDGTVAKAPYELTLPCFASATITVKSPGFFDETRHLPRFSKGDMTVPLRPVFTLDSIPTDATVTLDGKTIGKTPLNLKLPDQNATLTVAKDSFLVKTITVQPDRKPRTLTCTLTPDGPGRHALKLGFTTYGFPLVKQLQDDSLDLQRKQRDQAVRLITFQPECFPSYLTPIQNSTNLLVLCLHNRTSATINKPSATIMLFNPEEQSLTNYTSDQYFHLSATVADQSVFYSSMQTGRFDIWSRTLAPQDNAPQLVLSNSNVKCQLTTRDKAMLFTAFTPKHTDDPRIWIASIDHSYLTELRELSSGEQPAWPHQGRTVLYQKLDKGKNSTWFPNTKIWTVMTDGSMKRKLSDNTGCIDKNPAWTKDDKHVIFASNRNQKNHNVFNLWIMDADGKHPRQLTHSSALDDCPVPTPDGKAVIFRSNRNLHWGLWKINLPTDR